MGSIPAKGCQLSRVLTTVVIVLTLSMTVHPSDVTTGAIGYDDMTINWRIETIDNGSIVVPGKASIAVDPSGGVHVSYHDAVADGLRYAYRPADGNWTSQVIDTPGVGNFSEIGVDSKGVVHIAYEDLAHGALKYAVKWPGEDWDIRVVDPGPGTGGFPTLDIDGGDRVFITYVDSSTSSIRMAALDDGGGWNISDVVVGGHAYWGGLDLAIGGNGSMHLVYLAGDLHPQYLQGFYAYRWPGQEWQAESVPFLEYGDTSISIAVNDYGIPYMAANGGYVLFHRSPTGHWGSYSYFKDQGFSSYGDIRYDSKANWLVCGRTSYEDLRYYQFTPVGHFRTGIVDDRTGTGLYASMAVGPYDRFHIVYYNEADGRLEYATDTDRPSEPVGLKATGGERDVLLEWGMPTHLGNATSVTFDIYRDDQMTHMYELYCSGWTGTSFLDTEVEDQGLHHYYVVAVNGAGEGDFPPLVWAWPQVRPTRPLNVTATAGPDYIVLHWEPPRDPGVYTVTDYRIYWRTGTFISGFGPEWQYPLSDWNNVTVDASVKSYNHTGLLHGYTYTYEIAAMRTGGEGERSKDVSAIPMVPPGMPMALKAVRGDGCVILNWTRPVDDGGCRLTAYKVYRGTSVHNLKLLTTINGREGDFNLWQEPSTTLMDNGTVPPELGGYSDELNGYLYRYHFNDTPGALDKSVTYYYQVLAVQLAGEGPRSHIVKVPSETMVNVPEDLKELVAPYAIVAMVVVGTVLVGAVMRRMVGRKKHAD